MSGELNAQGISAALLAAAAADPHWEVLEKERKMRPTKIPIVGGEAKTGDEVTVRWADGNNYKGTIMNIISESEFNRTSGAPPQHGGDVYNVIYPAQLGKPKDNRWHLITDAKHVLKVVKGGRRRRRRRRSSKRRGRRHNTKKKSYRRHRRRTRRRKKSRH
jgi:hypothetical protein